MAIPWSHRPVFLFLFWPGTSVTIPRTRSVRLGYGHWSPSLNYQKKKKNDLTDSVMATGVKKTRSARPWYGIWHSDANCDRKNTPAWQTVVWQLELQKPGLSDRGVVNGVTKFRMASGGLNFSVVYGAQKMWWKFQTCSKWCRKSNILFLTFWTTFESLNSLETFCTSGCNYPQHTCKINARKKQVSLLLQCLVL